MRVPGSNLLRIATKLVKPTTLGYFKYLGRTVDLRGNYISAYAPYVKITSTVHSVSRNKYHQMGLDLQKSYIFLHVFIAFEDLGRDYPGDRFLWGGDVYQAINQNDWHIRDGWSSGLAVDIGPRSNYPDMVMK